tara:strand:- start:236 stop:400 length:165 start_codon:yes stop_codon:yes gene_type:complete
MEKKQIAWLLIFTGFAIFLLKFLKTIITFVIGHPFLGFAFVIIVCGLFILAYEE